MKYIFDYLIPFTPATSSTSGQLNFSGVSWFNIRRLFLVINLTRNKIIYQAGEQGLGFTAYNGGVITLEANTIGHSSSDTLTAVYEDTRGDATDSKLEAIRLLLAGTLSVRPPGDQDPVFDHANGVKVTVNASTKLLTPPTGCKYLRVSAESDVMIHTAGGPAADDGKSIRVPSGVAEVIPVVAAQDVYAMSLSGVATIVRAVPMKARV